MKTDTKILHTIVANPIFEIRKSNMMTNAHQEYKSDLPLENVCVIHHIIRFKEKKHVLIHSPKRATLKLNILLL